jgi:hypothetical protein
MKNGSCPSGVNLALLSHSTWMRPAKVSATTGPADIRSTTGCSPVGSAGKSPRFLPIPRRHVGQSLGMFHDASHGLLLKRAAGTGIVGCIPVGRHPRRVSAAVLNHSPAGAIGPLSKSILAISNPPQQTLRAGRISAVSAQCFRRRFPFTRTIGVIDHAPE